ncbi:unnamed protein product [Cladocopium goreaui]|uniref:Uncharacterized protein n=1 Tax=Cladocopium goreaui TaxID=2562237 RepID=A0A9P1BRP3_9DINO|nr:unnamed protein product [Cladocopium goreaui]
MFGMSLPSRTFSSQSLMDGEALISSQDLGSMTEIEMLAELKQLEDLKRQVEAQRPVAAPLRGNDVTVPAPDDLHEHVDSDPYLHDQEPDPSTTIARQLSFAAAMEPPETPARELVDIPTVVAGLSRSAAKKRVGRLMQRKADGTFKVPSELADAWASGDQDSMVTEFIDAGLDKEVFIKRSLRRIREKTKEKELWVDGKFISEDHMRDELKLKESRIKRIKEICQKKKGWIRRDQYEKNVKLYWYEGNISGRKLKRKRDTVIGEGSSDVDDADLEDSDMELDDEFNHKEIQMDADDEAVSERAEDKLTEAQALKQITFPEMDDDGLPSSYIAKVLTCLGKWQVKMGDLSMKLSSGGHRSLKPLADKTSERDKSLAECTEKLAELNTHGICHGFTAKHQSELKTIFHQSKAECREALCLQSRAVPFLKHINQQRKRVKQEQ